MVSLLIQILDMSGMIISLKTENHLFPYSLLEGFYISFAVSFDNN
jgi:hypothetical protein